MIIPRTVILFNAPSPKRILIAGLTIILLLFCFKNEILNLLRGFFLFFSTTINGSSPDYLAKFYILFTPYNNYIKLLAPLNIIYFSSYLLIFRRYIAPARYVVSMAHRTLSAMQPNPSEIAPIPNASLMQVVTTLAHCAQEQSRLRADLNHELETARQVLAQFTSQQNNLLQSASHSMLNQYRTVVGYANYLDQHILRHHHLVDLRYDFDDVCESGFNLKLIAGALDMLSHPSAFQPQSVLLPSLMQQTMLALSASLDRRSMKLTTQEVDLSVSVTTDPIIITQVLWMMMLGTIRYAALESTLRMRCLYDETGKYALMSIVVSELAPGTMTADERRDHLQRQLHTRAAHMFAETIHEQANLQLARLLLKKINAEIDVIPLSHYACEICLKLPL